MYWCAISQNSIFNHRTYIERSSTQNNLGWLYEISLKTKFYKKFLKKEKKKKKGKKYSEFG